MNNVVTLPAVQPLARLAGDINKQHAEVGSINLMNAMDTDTPSGRIRHALGALKQWESMPNCRVAMNEFHGYVKGVCIACLGGAAVAIKYYMPHEWPELARYCLTKPDLENYEYSLDMFRTGDTGDAFLLMGLSSKEGNEFIRTITDYHEDSEAFYDEMYQLAEDLENAGY